MLLRRAGLVWSVRTPRDLPYRPELRRLDVSRPLPREHPDEVVLVAPAGPLSLARIQALVGPAVPVRLDPWTERLELWHRGARSRGLPALVEAMALRRGAWSLAAMALLPCARGFERARCALDLE